MGLRICVFIHAEPDSLIAQGVENRPWSREGRGAWTLDNKSWAPIFILGEGQGAKWEMLEGEKP